MSAWYVTPHFTLEEFTCKTGQKVPPELTENLDRLCEQLELVRERWAAPLVVVCGYRSPEYNDALRRAAIKQGRIPGQAEHSRHLTAEAADVRPVAPGALDRFRQVVDDLVHEKQLEGIGGIGWYPGQWIHLDVRPRGPGGHIARWQGAGAGSEP